MYTDEEMSVAKQITRFREERGYSVNKLANLAGISQSYLREVELGNRNPTVEVLSYICDALKISLADFFIAYCGQDTSVDSLMREIYRLSPHERELLEKFLHSILFTRKQINRLD